MKSPRRRIYLGTAVILVLVAGLAATAGALRSGPAETGQGRAVAIGDVHGDYADFSHLLQQVGLIDENHQWTGGAATFVQTGDVPDRGAQSKQVFDLLMSLAPEATKAQGKVIPLLGNHEVMDMVGDLRYVTADDYKNFADENSEKRREAEWEDYKKFLASHRGHQHSLLGEDAAARDQWMAAHPIGFFERFDALGPKGVYGRWLRAHDCIAQVGPVLFMHGGLDPSLHFKNINELNGEIRKELQQFDSVWEFLWKRHLIWRYMTFSEALKQIQEEATEMRTRGVPDEAAVEEMKRLNDTTSGLLFAPNGPLWYRGYALEPEEKLRPHFFPMMKRLKAEYLVSAHTVNKKFNITPHLDKHVFLIDTGMLTSYFGGRGSALVLENGTFTAVYVGGESEVLLSPAATGAATGTQP